MSNKNYNVTFRVDLKMWGEINKLASEMEGGNISRFMRKLLKRVIKNAKDL